MTIPRYWDTDARNQLDNVRQISEQAYNTPGRTKPPNLNIMTSSARPRMDAIPVLP